MTKKQLERGKEIEDAMGTIDWQIERWEKTTTPGKSAMPLDHVPPHLFFDFRAICLKELRVKKETLSKELEVL